MIKAQHEQWRGVWCEYPTTSIVVAVKKNCCVDVVGVTDDVEHSWHCVR